MKVYRQGDVGIILNGDTKIESAIEKGDLVVAHGEVTGHAHRITSGDAKIMIAKAFEKAKQSVTEMRIQALTPITITHEEHEGIVLPIGNHRTTIQREHDWISKMARKVID